MIGARGRKEKNKEERNDTMEKILSEILNELRDFREEMRDVKQDLREVKQEVRESKEENRKEHEEFRQEIRELKQEMSEFKEENRKEHEQMRIENQKEHEQIRKEIKEATDFIIDTTRSIERIVTEIKHDQQKQERHLILIKNVNLEKNKSQDARLALHQTRIERCENKLAEILN